MRGVKVNRAYKKKAHESYNDISWSDDWTPTDAKEHADYDGTVFTEPDFD